MIRGPIWRCPTPGCPHESEHPGLCPTHLLERRPRGSSVTGNCPETNHAPPAAIALDFPWGQRVVVPADGLHIGRASALLSEQVRHYGQVAWRHARLWWRDGELLVDDCDSATRTRVDGEPITAGRPVRLRPGQCLSLGPNLHVRVVTPDQPGRRHGRALA